MNKTVCAVVVTYNRKELLLKCLESIKKQSKPLDAIYLIDNASTDGTPHILKENNYIKEIPPETLQNPWENMFIIKNSTNKNDLKLHYVRIHENTGGAGGFHEGIKRAYKKGYDWLWLMDDDTLASNNSLNNLLNKVDILDEKAGFFCSKVLWKDKNIHLMNIPQIQPFITNIPFNRYEDKDILLVKAASFVSVLLQKEIISEFGFPLKKFFIWGDDVEYTSRITNNNYIGIYVKDSIVYHNTKENYSTDIFSDRIENLWKYSFGIRNNLYIIKQRSIIIFFVYILYHILGVNFNILRYRKDNKLNFLVVNTKASLSSLVFKPEEDN